MRQPYFGYHSTYTIYFLVRLLVLAFAGVQSMLRIMIFVIGFLIRGLQIEYGIFSVLYSLHPFRYVVRYRDVARVRFLYISITACTVE